MENTVDIRKKIHEFINYADERILRIMNAIISTEQEEEIIGTEPKKILDQRLKDHADNRNSGKLWNEVKNNLQEKYGL
ncbi:addiction module family protein [uncultured Chryseobacterium sp.]|uniref:addiction module family protein n=1 Tax=uncultured Chryseobacterium sp. TaxID=259322 RepID=UPI0025FDF4F9|nr:addiction module family protein [uncultured Chryseobacterium sp.]